MARYGRQVYRCTCLSASRRRLRCCSFLNAQHWGRSSGYSAAMAPSMRDCCHGGTPKRPAPIAGDPILSSLFSARRSLIFPASACDFVLLLGGQYVSPGELDPWAVETALILPGWSSRAAAPLSILPPYTLLAIDLLAVVLNASPSPSTLRDTSHTPARSKDGSRT